MKLLNAKNAQLISECSKTTFEMLKLKNGLEAKKFGIWLQMERRISRQFRQAMSQLQLTN